MSPPLFKDRFLNYRQEVSITEKPCKDYSEPDSDSESDNETVSDVDSDLDTSERGRRTGSNDSDSDSNEQADFCPMFIIR